MNVLDVTVKTERVNSGQFRVYPIGDLHLDAAATDRSRLNTYIQKIAADPYSFWVLVGDLLDGTTPSHRWFEISAVAPDVLINMDRYIAHSMLELEHCLAPLATRPGVVIQGNHDLRPGGTLWSGLCWEITRRLNEVKDSAQIQYGGDECLIRLRAPEQRSGGAKGKDNHFFYTIHVHHGAGGGIYPGGKVNRFENTISKLTDADIMIRGHVHDSDIRIVPYYTVTRRGPVRLKEKKRVYITAPAFWPGRKEGLNNYASRKGYPPNDEGIMYLNIELPSRKGRHDGKMWRSELPI